jgi:hypothetical protein
MVLKKWSLHFKDNVLEEAFCEKELKNIEKAARSAIKIMCSLTIISVLYNGIEIAISSKNPYMLFGLIIHSVVLGIAYILQRKFNLVRFNIGNVFVILNYLFILEIHISFFPNQLLFA